MPRSWPYCPPRRGRTTFSHMYILLSQLNLQTQPTTAPAFTMLHVVHVFRRKSLIAAPCTDIMILEIWCRRRSFRSTTLDSSSKIPPEDSTISHPGCRSAIPHSSAPLPAKNRPIPDTVRLSHVYVDLLHVTASSSSQSCTPPKHTNYRYLLHFFDRRQEVISDFLIACYM